MMDTDSGNMHDTIERLFDGIDENGTGTIQVEEFESICENVELHELLEKLGLNVTHETAHGFFAMLNFNGDGWLSKQEFHTGITRVSGPAKSIDMAQVMVNYTKVLQLVEDFVLLEGGTLNERGHIPSYVHE